MARIELASLSSTTRMGPAGGVTASSDRRTRSCLQPSRGWQRSRGSGDGRADRVGLQRPVPASALAVRGHRPGVVGGRIGAGDRDCADPLLTMIPPPPSAFFPPEHPIVAVFGNVLSFAEVVLATRL